MALKRRAPKNPALSPEEEDELTVDLNRGGDVGGLEMAANILDVPSAMLRNTLAGRNPLSPVIHPLSGEDRISGRDLLEQYGMVDPNVDKGWTPDAGDWAGFGADVVLDPLNLFGGLGAYIKGASKGAKTAGVAAKTLGEGIRAGERALVGVKLHPFARTSKWGIGTGERSAQLADMLGKGGKYVSESTPARYLKSALNARYMNTITDPAQKAAAEIFDKFPEMDAETRELVGKHVTKLLDSGVITPDDIKAKDFTKLNEWGRKYREEFELGDRKGPWAPRPPVDPVMAEIIAEQKTHLRNLQNNLRLAGGFAPDLEDVSGISYHPRSISGDSPMTPKDMVFNTRDLASHGREEHLKGLWEGTKDLQDIFSDPDVKAELARLAGNRNAAAEVGKVIERKFAPRFVETDPAARLAQAVEIAGTANRMDPSIAARGGYDTFPFLDFMRHAAYRNRATTASHGVIDLMAKHAQPLSYFGKGEKSQSILDIMQQVGMHPGGEHTLGGLPLLAQKLNLNMMDPDVIKQLQGYRVGKDLGDDMVRLFETFGTPQNVRDPLKLYDSVTNFTKAWLLAHPARYNRDRATGFLQNLFTGNTGIGPEKMWSAMRQGKDVPGASKIPEVAAMLAERGLPVDDANATKMLREVVFAHQPISAAETAFGGIPKQPGSIEEILGQMPGVIPFDYTDMFRAGDSWNPLELRGVLNTKTKELRDYTRFKPIAGAEHLGYGFDAANRMPPFLKNIMEGMDPGEAKKLVDEIQVSYDPRTYSEFEKKIAKRVFPFYSFTSRMMKTVGKELANNPSGPTAQMIRRANDFRGDQEGDPIPEHLKESLSIGLGELPDGSKRYLAGLGLMHEDPLSILSSSPQDMALELLSRINPIPKVIIEKAFGQSTFQRGPEGGRPLDDLDPPIGRTLSNIAGGLGIEGFTTDEGDPRRLSPGQTIEHIASNSPISRLLSSVRTATDPRKEWWAKAINLLSGVRIYDASEGAMDATLRKMVERAERDSGARSYKKVYFTKDQLAKMNPEEREAADRLRSLSRMLDSRAKKRRQEKEAEKAKGATAT